jgi:hypothetical protein
MSSIVISDQEGGCEKKLRRRWIKQVFFEKYTYKPGVVS